MKEISRLTATSAVNEFDVKSPWKHICAASYLFRSKYLSFISGSYNIVTVAVTYKQKNLFLLN
jgi:hypothetical protein